MNPITYLCELYRGNPAGAWFCGVLFICSVLAILTTQLFDREFDEYMNQVDRETYSILHEGEE